METGMPPAVQAMLGSVIRWGVTILATRMVDKGIWTKEEAHSYVLYLVGMGLMLVWSLWQKRSMFKNYFTALATHGASSHDDVLKAVASGQAPPITLNAQQVPFLRTPNPPNVG